MCRLGLVHTEDCLCQTDTVTGPQWVPRAYSTALFWPLSRAARTRQCQCPPWKKKTAYDYVRLTQWQACSESPEHVLQLCSAPSPEQQECDSVSVSVPHGATPQEQLWGNMEDLLNINLHLHHQSDHLRQNHTQMQKKKLFKKTKRKPCIPCPKG